MKRSKSSHKSNFPMILAAVGVGVGLYFLIHKASAATLASGTDASSGAAAIAYNNTRTAISNAIASDGQSANFSDGDLVTLTNSYLKGDPTDLTSLINYLHGKGATNTANMFSNQLTTVNAAKAAAAGAPVVVAAATPAAASGYGWF